MAANELKGTRDRSTIQFPYKDLESAIDTAKAIHDSGAVSGVAPDQLAAMLGITGGSGNFLSRVSTARLFGLVGASTPYQLTELGHEILDKDRARQRAAITRAFLSVPLYRKLYDTYRGKALPPRPLGLERALVDFGVVAKSAKVARQAFERSAKQAGFFDSGEDRLIEPFVGLVPPPSPSGQKHTADLSGLVSVSPTHTLPNVRHPFIQGLLESLPDPGSEWDVYGRADWLEAAEKIFGLIYKGRNGQIVFNVMPFEPDQVPVTDSARQARTSHPALPSPATGPSSARPVSRGSNADPDEDIPF